MLRLALTAWPFSAEAKAAKATAAASILTKGDGSGGAAGGKREGRDSASAVADGPTEGGSDWHRFSIHQIIFPFLPFLKLSLYRRRPCRRSGFFAGSLASSTSSDCSMLQTGLQRFPTTVPPISVGLRP